MESGEDIAPLIGDEHQSFTLSSKWRGSRGVVVAKHSVCESTWSTFKRNKSIILWIIASVITSTMQNVYFKKAGDAMPSNAYFMFWFTAIIFTSMFFVLLAFAMCAKQLTAEMRSVSQLKYFVIGALITTTGIFMLFANPHVPGVMQALLGPTVVTIPLSMIFSFLLLKRKYGWKQVLAVLTILFGLGVALYPSITQKGSTSSTGSMGWNAIFFVGSVPITLATVYQERIFAQTPVHIAHVLACSSLWQTLTIFLSAPIDLIPHFGTTTASDFLDQQYYALRCLARFPVDASQCPGCSCDTAWQQYLLFTLIYMLSNFTGLGVVKYGNATLMYVVSTIALPLTEFAFSWEWLMGPGQAESISMYEYISLAVLGVGVLLYRLFDSSGVYEAKQPSELEPQSINIGLTDDVIAVDSGDEVARDTLTMSCLPSYLSMQPHLYAKKQATEEYFEYPSRRTEGNPLQQYWTI